MTAQEPVPAHTVTNAAYVAQTNMEPRSARPQLDDIFSIVTSFKHEVWLKELRDSKRLHSSFYFFSSEPRFLYLA
jgi:hypothetical protein